MKKMLVCCCIVLSALLLSGCPQKVTPVYAEAGVAYRSSVEGYYHCKSKWNSRVPVMFTQERGKIVQHFGEILSVTDSGFVFDEARLGPFLNPGEKFFPFSETIALIDSNYQFVYGELPDNYLRVWFMKVNVRNAETGREYQFTLTPNKPFGFYLPPGTYHLKAVNLVSEQGEMQEGVELPDLRFIIEDQVVNYLGDFNLNMTEEPQQENMILIPFQKWGKRSTAFMAGFLGGLVGGGLYLSMKSTTKNRAFHLLEIIDNPEFKQIAAGLPVERNVLNLKIDPQPD